MRLDSYLVEQGHFESRARAQAAIKAGLVCVNGAVASKSSQSVAPESNVEIAGDVHPYVSRGGVKLEAALRAMEIEPAGRISLDLGASTGGFTDALLRAGAAKVYAVDVGRGQLHERIAGDPRVINLEQTHAKDLDRTLVPDPIDIIVCDVSFISLTKALPPALELAAPVCDGAQIMDRPRSRRGARLIALIKPQFEVGRAALGKGGIVKPGFENNEGVAERLSRWLSEQPGWTSTGYVESPIRGGDGNREFLLGGVMSL